MCGGEGVRDGRHRGARVECECLGCEPVRAETPGARQARMIREAARRADARMRSER